MSFTYPSDPIRSTDRPLEAPGAELVRDEPFVPVYARRGKAQGGKGKIKAWMILVPVGALALAGMGAMMMSNQGDTSEPLAQPARTLPVLPATPTANAVAPLTTASTPSPVVRAAALREAAPVRRPAASAPARREATPAPVARSTARVAAPAATVPSGPQAYAPAPAPAPTPPVIIVEPVG